MFFAFEESPQQLVRNMNSVGIELTPWLENGQLLIEASRPTLNGLEKHLVSIHKQVSIHKPDAVIIDPISNLITVGNIAEVRSMLTRLIDFLKVNNITALFTSLLSGSSQRQEMTEEGVSSLVDTWISVRDLEGIGERNRGISILKARGMAHSNQVREFIVTSNGIQLLDVVIGPEGIVTGASRLTQQLQQQAQARAVRQEQERKDRELARKRLVLEATIANLRTEFESVEEELRQISHEEQTRQRNSMGKPNPAGAAEGEQTTPSADQ
ncbi:ATPase domain-containing protein [Hymenobacter sp. 5414T-23]|uniref:ATPase domain-containing protein n=1 Tax=Hymenobacter sp. 5414T-23 TaxID=2932252 RepID=UPI001FD522F3|nr:ATPase domain-containing protein [Hymenobacter sp. 5414T-23]UOQ79758.1 hypothetical protein MUN83_12970 [Hymenobacter sp. 5414T-23]